MNDDFLPMKIQCGGFDLILVRHVNGQYQWQGTTERDIPPGMFQINEHLPFMFGLFGTIRDHNNVKHVSSVGVVYLSMNDPSAQAAQVCLSAGELSDAYKAVEEHRNNPTVLRPATLKLLKAVEKWRTVSEWKSDGGSSSSPG